VRRCWQSGGNTLRMVETAVHLGDRFFWPLPVLQWVLSLPKRQRKVGAEQVYGCAK